MSNAPVDGRNIIVPTPFQTNNFVLVIMTYIPNIVYDSNITKYHLHLLVCTLQSAGRGENLRDCGAWMSYFASQKSQTR